MKARKVVTRSGRGYRGYFPSIKLNRMVEWESLLERDFILLLEFSPAVESYREQPEKIQYERDGELYYYFPDFEVDLYSGEILHVEVKPKRKLSGKELQGKFQAISRRYDRHEATFKIMTEEEIRKEPLFSNLQKLCRYRGKLKFDLDEEWNEFKNTLAPDVAYTVNQLSKRFGIHKTMALLANHGIFCDLCIDLDSVVNFVRLPTEAEYDALLF